MKAVDFIRGDANTDGILDISDSIYTLDYLYSGGIVIMTTPIGRGIRKPPRGGLHVGKAPLGLFVLPILRVLLAVHQAITLLLIPHVTPNLLFVEANRAHAIPDRPEV